MTLSTRLGLAASLALIVGCHDDPGPTNALLPTTDVRTDVVGFDAASPDAGSPLADVDPGPGTDTSPAVDISPATDTSVGADDAGALPPDSGEPTDGSGPVDGEDPLPGDVVDPGDTGAPATCGDWGLATDEPGTGDSDFPWGVASGAVQSTSAVLWTRLDSPGSVTVTVSGGPECDDVVLGPLAATNESGLTVHAKVTGLEADRLYQFRFERVGGAGPSSAGWLHTPSEADSAFTVIFAGDIDSGNPAADVMWDAFQTSGADRLLWLGDWPYADKNGAAAVTLDEYRDKLATDRASLPAIDFLRFVPIEANWDDHEVVNDWDGADTLGQPLRVEAGKQAWREWFPVEGAVAGEIYRRYSLGPNVEVFQLDCRSHRDANDAPNIASKTMLGDVQLAWLLDALSSSTAAFKLVLTSVPLDYGTTAADHWPGFAYERDVILDAIESEGLSGVVFLTADQHWLAVHDMPSGEKEWQVGPAGTATRAPSAQPPEVLFQVQVVNAGLIEYAPNPPRLTFTAFDESSVPLYAETIQAGRGQLAIDTAEPNAPWTITGTHLFHGTGPKVLPLATPGPYTIFWGPSGAKPPPSPETVILDDGGAVTFTGDYSGAGPSLWDPFTAATLGAGWTIVNQGVADASPAWTVTNGWVQETGNAYDEKTDQAVAPKLGTFLWAKGTTLASGAIVARLYAGDNDGLGLMYGMQDKDSYYRISFDAENSFARLVRDDDGAFTVLAEDLDFAPPEGAWTTVAVERDGDLHRVFAEGRLLFEVSDATYASGSIALYSWGMSDARFDDVAVYPAP